jgi:hypothetical protein
VVSNLCGHSVRQAPIDRSPQSLKLLVEACHTAAHGHEDEGMLPLLQYAALRERGPLTDRSATGTRSVSGSARHKNECLGPRLETAR